MDGSERWAAPPNRSERIPSGEAALDLAHRVAAARSPTLGTDARGAERVSPLER